MHFKKTKIINFSWSRNKRQEKTLTGSSVKMRNGQTDEMRTRDD